MDSGDATVKGSGGVRENNGFTVEQHLTAVGPVHSREDADHRAFAGAVVTEEAVHFTSADAHADVVQRDDAAEVFAYVPDFECFCGQLDQPACVARLRT